MFAIHRYGIEEQKRTWLPRMAAGEALGCFGLTEPDAGSDPGVMRTNAQRDGSEWVLNGARCGSPTGHGRVAVVWARTDDGIRGFVVPADAPGFTANEIQRKLSLRASHTAELVLDGFRLPAERCCPRSPVCKRSADMPE